MKRTSTTKSKASLKKKELAVFNTSADLRSAVLVVSLLANIFVLCIWITLQITDKYDQSLINFFIQR